MMTKLLNTAALVSLSNAFAATAAKDATKGGPSTPAPEAAEPAAVAPKVDPFASLPTISVGDYELRDLSSVRTAEPRKYTAAQEAAMKARSQLKQGWKHATAVLASGPFQPDNVKPTSVMGLIMNKVASYGRAGVPAYVIVDFLRREAVDNKRSHYCAGNLPPIGWAEDYINGALSKKYVRVMEGKVAPAIAPEAPTAEAGESAKTKAA